MDIRALKKENKKLKGLLKDAVRLLDQYKQVVLNAQSAKAPVAPARAKRKETAYRTRTKTKAKTSARANAGRAR